MAKPSITGGDQRAYQVAIVHAKANRIMRNHLTTTLLPYNLSVQMWMILGILSDYEHLRVSELAKILGVKTPLVTVLLRDLVEKALVDRKGNQRDRRSTIILITNSGRQLVKQAEPAVAQSMQILFGGVSAKSLTTYLQVLEALTEQ